MARNFWLPLALFCSVLATAQAAAAQSGPGSEAAARQAFEDGRDAYEQGRFDRALTSFERSYALSGRPALLFNIGRSAEAEGRTQRAIEAYERYLQQVPNAENAAFVQGRLRKLRGLRRAEEGRAERSAGTAEVRNSEPIDAREEREPQRWRLYGGFRLGFGGKWRASNYSSDTTLDLKRMFGAQLGAAYVRPYFGLAAEVRLSSFKGGYDGDQIWDLIMKPFYRHEFVRLPLELHAAVPFGLSVPRLGVPIDIEEYVGFNLGLIVGATFFFSEHLGVSAEMGWQMHWVSFSVPGSDNFLPTDLSYKQWTLLAASFVFAL